MSRNWSLFLVVAFVLGFGTKTYLDGQKEVEKKPQQIATEQSVLFGEGDKPVDIFDTSDNRIRIVYFGFTRCQMCVQLH